MLLRRRASLPSASDVRRRVCDDVATNSTLVRAGHCAKRISSSPSRSVAHSLSTIMDRAPPRTVPATSPTSTCKWKRGRPVPARSTISAPTPPNSNWQVSNMAGQTLNNCTATLRGGQQQVRQASTTRHLGLPQTRVTEAPVLDGAPRTELWHPSQALLFAPMACTEERQSRSPPSHEPFNRLFPDECTTNTVNESRHGSTVKGHHDVGIDIDDRTVDEPTPDTHKEMEQLNAVKVEGTEDDVPEPKTEEGVPNEDDIETVTQLTYQIPEDDLRTAMLASPNTRASYWNTKLYRGPNNESILTHYCKTLEVAERVAQHFLNEKVVGFDIEWKIRGRPNSTKENASLIQLACENRVALFHVSLFSGRKVEQLMPPSLKAVLESPDIIKTGVAVKGDFTRLDKYLSVKAQGVFELSRLHNLVVWHGVDQSKINNRLVGLATQVLQHLHLPLYKGEPLADDPSVTSSVRESDWSLALNVEQIHYAAADAYAGFRLYYALEEKRVKLKPVPVAVGLCDYDSARAPRSKKPRPKLRTTRPEDASGSNPEPSVVVTEQEQEEGEEETEGYETAPEELDSHQVEDPPTKLPTAAYKRVGRIRLSKLRDPVPEYPILPEVSERETDEQLTSVQLDGLSVPHLSVTEDVGEDDEFPDPELEAALKVIDVDSDGVLKIDGQLAASIVETGAEELIAESTPSVAQPSLEMDHALEEYALKIEIADDAGASEPTGLTESQEEHKTSSTTLTFASLIVQSEGYHTAEYEVASTWAQNYLKATIPSPTSTIPSRLRATVTHLRAYHLWHHQNLSIDTIAGYLREPPLASSTVSTYVLQSITAEKLPYDKVALKEIIMLLPPMLRNGRWKWMAETVGASK